MGFGLGRPELVVPRFAVYVEPCELRRAKRVAKEEVFILLKFGKKLEVATLRMEVSAMNVEIPLLDFSACRFAPCSFSPSVTAFEADNYHIYVIFRKIIPTAPNHKQVITEKKA